MIHITVLEFNGGKEPNANTIIAHGGHVLTCKKNSFSFLAKRNFAPRLLDTWMSPHEQYGDMLCLSCVGFFHSGTRIQ